MSRSRSSAASLSRFPDGQRPRSRTRPWRGCAAEPNTAIRPDWFKFVWLLTGIYDEAENILYEAKGTATRGAIRTAIGQLLDYRRHIDRDNVRLAILLPHRPSEDLVDLVTSLGIALVAEKDRGGFESIAPRAARSAASV